MHARAVDALRRNEMDLLARLLADNPSLAHVPSEEGSYLIDRCACPSSTDPAHGGYAQALAMLLEAGADGGARQLLLAEPLPPLSLASLYRRMTQSIGTADDAPYAAAGVGAGGGVGLGASQPFFTLVASQPLVTWSSAAPPNVVPSPT